MSFTDISRIKIRRIVIVLVIITAIVLHQRFLIIKEVTCRMGSSVCPEGITVLLDRVKGSSLLRFNQKDLQKQILSTGLVDQVKFNLKLPGKLVISGEPPPLSFLVKTAFGKTTPSLTFLTSSTSAAPSLELGSFVASMEGKTFQLLSTGVLNQTDANSNFFLISQSIPSKDYLSKAFNWLRSFTLSPTKPNAIYFLSDMIILKQNNQPDLIMNFSTNPAEIILALQRITQAVTIKKPIVIDFRYSHPILK